MTFKTAASRMLFIFLGIILCSFPVQAKPITSQEDLSPYNTVIDFESLPTGFTSNPLTLSRATFSSQTSLQIHDSSSYYASIAFPNYVHGHYITSPRHGAKSDPITITFSQPISKIGVGIFDPNYAGNYLKVFDSSGLLLEMVESKTGPVGGSFADFIGVIRPTKEIAYVEVVAATADYIGVDNVTFDISPTPVGYWKFEETSGDSALDSSDFGNDGTIHGATRTSGKCGKALSFDAGSDGDIDYVVVPNSDSINTSTFTVSCWMSLPNLDGHYHFLDKRNGQWHRNFSLSYHGNDDRPEGQPDSDYLRVQIGDGSYMPTDYDNSAYARVSLNQDQYHYVAGTYDGNTLRLYLDGNEIASEDIVMPGNIGNGDLIIGSHGYPYMTPMFGIIDEVRIYDHALTQEEIQADMWGCEPEKGLVYTTVPPCRVVDTRKAGGLIPPTGIRSYNVWGAVASQGGNPAGCPSPKGEPRAVALNVTAVPLGNGNIVAYPFGSAPPNASLVNYRADAQNVANSGTVKTCFNCTKDISVKSSFGTAHVVIDVLGYYFAKP